MNEVCNSDIYKQSNTSLIDGNFCWFEQVAVSAGSIISF